MGQAEAPNFQPATSAEDASFAFAYQRWQQLYDYEPQLEPGETLEQFEARGDRIGEDFRKAERAILLSQPANHTEIIAMLSVISGAEEVGADQRAALCSIQIALASGALRETGVELHLQ